MNRLLDLLQPVSAYDDRRVILPLQLNRAEEEMLYALLQRRISDDFADRDLVKEAHEALASKLHYYVTDTPLPSQS